jgi:glutamyl-tRNA synthetase
LGATVPKFLHLPLIQNQQGKKLAKRDPTSSLVTLKKEYEPEAIKNFIFRLGWNPKKNPNEKNEVEILIDE